jgi:hypothetical protein
MVLIAGFILSSFPPDRMRSKPHHRIKTIDSIHAARTKIDIARRMNSQKSILASNIDPDSFTAYTVE